MAKKSSKWQGRTRKPSSQGAFTPCLTSNGEGVEPFPYYKYLTHDELDEVHGATITIEEMLSRAKGRMDAGAPVLFNAQRRKAYDDAMTKAIRMRIQSAKRLEKWEAKARAKREAVKS